MGNYRSVSLTAQACKLLKSILRDNIIRHLRDFNLIKSSQHGSVKNRSCLTNLLEFLEYVCDYIDKGLPVDVIYLDFRKAFDKVGQYRKDPWSSHENSQARMQTGHTVVFLLAEGRGELEWVG